MAALPDDPCDLDVGATVAAVQAGTLSAEAIAAGFLRRIAAAEPVVQAWAFLDPERALEEARATDRNGPLAGVTFGVKDIIDTADMPTEYGSAAYQGTRPAWDAPCVAALRHAGGVVLGKTVSTEFAMASPGKTRNPINPAHTPGGSSSGSCAAVAAGMVHAAFGTQTAGSIIRPASYCGVVGYKPSFGTLNRTAVKVLSESLDTLGLITRTVRDAAVLAAVLAERPSLAVRTAPPPRIGLFRTSRWQNAEPATRDALARAAAAVSRSGGCVTEIETPDGFDALYHLHDIVMGWETPRSLAYERYRLAEKMTVTTLTLVNQTLAATSDQYQAAQAALRDRAQWLDRLLAGVDVLVTPAAPGEAPLGLQSTGDPMFNKIWTLLHGPAITLPAGLGPNGLPVGVQVVGRLGDDARLLAAAAAIEDALAAPP